MQKRKAANSEEQRRRADTLRHESLQRADALYWMQKLKDLGLPANVDVARARNKEAFERRWRQR